MLFSRRNKKAANARRNIHRLAKKKSAHKENTRKENVQETRKQKAMKMPKRKAPKAAPVRKEHREKIKTTLHSLYFSKREPEPIEKPDFAPMIDKNLERRLEQVQQYFDKRIDNVDKSLMLLREIIDEFKRENESLRRDREFLLNKMNTIMTGTVDVARKEEMVPDEITVEEKPHITSYADHQGRSGTKTSMDQLLEMVMEKNSVKVSEAARKLQVKEKQVEEWSRMLEAHGLIEIHYPAFGKPVLKKKAAS